MEWSKIKNVILLILLLLNVILLMLVGKREYDTASYQDSALKSAEAVLNSSGITVTGDLPEDSSLTSLQISWSRDEAEERAQAEAILGEGVTQADGSGGSSMEYDGPGGTAVFFHDGTFLVDLNVGVWEAGEENAARHGQKCLGLLGFDAELVDSDQQTMKDAVTGETENRLTLTYRQRWQGSPIFSSKAVLTYRNGSLRQMEGDRIAGAVVAAGAETPLTVPTVLIRFLSEMNQGGYVCSEITSVMAGYTASSRLKLTPVWAITTDNKTTYYLDGITGLLSTSE